MRCIVRAMFVADPLRRLSSLLSLFACTLSLGTAACLCGSDGPGAEHKPVRELKPTSLADVSFEEGEAGDPAVMGCSDGQREGFADHTRYTEIAGCLGSWDGKKSLRDAATGTACGDDKGPCTVPADVCATGWHVCGNNGKAQDISDRVDADSCNDGAGPGKFVAAISHGQAPVVCPPPPEEDTEFPCMDKGLCAESVCCGQDCDFGSCRDAVWLDSTKISRGTAEGCGSVTAAANGGVLCCRDEGAAAAGTTPSKTEPAADPGAGVPGNAEGDAAKVEGEPATDGKVAEAGKGVAAGADAAKK